jgi:hypothetical protein
VALPTDRGYVTITDIGDGEKQVNVYAKMTPNGPSHLFASHTGLKIVLVQGEAGFTRHGRTRISGEPMEVSFNEEENRLYIKDIRAISSVLG